MTITSLMDTPLLQTSTGQAANGSVVTRPVSEADSRMNGETNDANRINQSNRTGDPAINDQQQQQHQSSPTTATNSTTDSNSKSHHADSESDESGDEDEDEDDDGQTHPMQLDEHGNTLPGTSRKGKRLKRADRGSCHQCKSARDNALLLSCTSPAEKGQRKRKCRKRYCAPCLARTYHIVLQELKPEEISHWCCPACKHECSCAACLRRAKMPPTIPIRANIPLGLMPLPLPIPMSMPMSMPMSLIPVNQLGMNMMPPPTMQQIPMPSQQNGMIIPPYGMQMVPVGMAPPPQFIQPPPPQPHLNMIQSNTMPMMMNETFPAIPSGMMLVPNNSVPVSNGYSNQSNPPTSSSSFPPQTIPTMQFVSSPQLQQQPQAPPPQPHPSVHFPQQHHPSQSSSAPFLQPSNQTNVQYSMQPPPSTSSTSSISTTIPITNTIPNFNAPTQSMPPMSQSYHQPNAPPTVINSNSFDINGHLGQSNPDSMMTVNHSPQPPAMMLNSHPPSNGQISLMAPSVTSNSSSITTQHYSGPPSSSASVTYPGPPQQIQPTTQYHSPSNLPTSTYTSSPPDSTTIRTNYEQPNRLSNDTYYHTEHHIPSNGLHPQNPISPEMYSYQHSQPVNHSQSRKRHLGTTGLSGDYSMTESTMSSSHDQSMTHSVITTTTPYQPHLPTSTSSPSHQSHQGGGFSPNTNNPYLPLNSQSYPTDPYRPSSSSSSSSPPSSTPTPRPSVIAAVPEGFARLAANRSTASDRPTMRSSSRGGGVSSGSSRGSSRTRGRSSSSSRGGSSNQYHRIHTPDQNPGYDDDSSNSSNGSQADPSSSTSSSYGRHHHLSSPSQSVINALTNLDLTQLEPDALYALHEQLQTQIQIKRRSGANSVESMNETLVAASNSDAPPSKKRRGSNASESTPEAQLTPVARTYAASTNPSPIVRIKSSRPRSAHHHRLGSSRTKSKALSSTGGLSAVELALKREQVLERLRGLQDSNREAMAKIGLKNLEALDLTHLSNQQLDALVILLTPAVTTPPTPVATLGTVPEHANRPLHHPTHTSTATPSLPQPSNTNFVSNSHPSLSSNPVHREFVFDHAHPHSVQQQYRTHQQQLASLNQIRQQSQLSHIMGSSSTSPPLSQMHPVQSNAPIRSPISPESMPPLTSTYNLPSPTRGRMDASKQVISPPISGQPQQQSYGPSGHQQLFPSPTPSPPANSSYLNNITVNVSVGSPNTPHGSIHSITSPNPITTHIPSMNANPSMSHSNTNSTNISSNALSFTSTLYNPFDDMLEDEDTTNISPDMNQSSPMNMNRMVFRESSGGQLKIFSPDEDGFPRYSDNSSLELPPVTEDTFTNMMQESAGSMQPNNDMFMRESSGSQFATTSNLLQSINPSALNGSPNPSPSPTAFNHDMEQDYAPTAST